MAGSSSLAPPRGIRIPRDGAALFDFDGTLCDTFPLHMRAYDEALAERGYAPFPRPVYRERVLRDGARPLDVLREIGLDVGEDLYLSKARRFGELAATELTARPGVSAVIERIRALGVRVAVVTSAGRPSVEPGLRAAWPGAGPDLVVTREDVARPKPDPEGFATAMRRLGAIPADTVVFEDAPPGIRAARASGAFCVAVAGWVFDASELGEADLVVGAWTELQVGADAGQVRFDTR